MERGARVTSMRLVSIRELVPPETHLAFPAMQALRTHLTDAAAFVREVDDDQRQEGYRLIGSFDEREDAAAAVAGFRVRTSLGWRRHLYVDDLATRPDTRRRGHGGRLLEWIYQEAVRLDCGQIHLDSGVGPERGGAHRLYLNAGFAITAHHFACVRAG